MKYLCMAMIAAVAIRGAQPDVQFEGVSAARFEAGSVIRVPKPPPAVKVAAVRVPDTSGQLKGTLRLELCERAPPATLARTADTEMLRATTGEPLGFFGEEDTCKLKVTTTRRDVKFSVPEWTIVTWPQAYILVTVGASGVPAPSIRIDEPAGGAFNFPVKPKSTLVKGAVLDQGDFTEVVKCGGYRVFVAGQETERDVTRGGWAFASEVDLGPGVTEVEVLVKDPRGSTTRALLPVVR